MIDNFRFVTKAALLVAVCALPVFGDVDFTTSGVFACGAAIGCSTSNGGSTVTITNNGNTLTMTATGFSYPADGSVVPNDPILGQANLITFNTSAASSPGVNTTGLEFTLDIDQTFPVGSPNSGTLMGSFAGSIDANGSDTMITFAPSQTSVTLAGNINYSLNFLDPSFPVWMIPNSGLTPAIGQATETGTISTTSVTPEPTFILLTGLGFAGLAFVAYRRKQAAQA
jgi:hypothetical protein